MLVAEGESIRKKLVDAFEEPDDASEPEDSEPTSESYSFNDPGDLNFDARRKTVYRVPRKTMSEEQRQGVFAAQSRRELRWSAAFVLQAAYHGHRAWCGFSTVRPSHDGNSPAILAGNSDNRHDGNQPATSATFCWTSSSTREHTQEMIRTSLR